jgi:hypothetical protein
MSGVHSMNDYTVGYIQHLCLPEDGCGFQSKCIAVIKPIIKLVGERLVYVRQSHRKCTCPRAVFANTLI